MKSKLPEEKWEMIELKEVSDYINEKVNIDVCTKDTYISTTNMLPNKAGIEVASSLPKAKSLNSFKKGDILISNIRPYFKKIWLATFDGTSSGDVLILRTKENIYNQYLYYVLSDDYFFDYTTKSAKGTKMPRGDKKAIMEYLVPDLPFVEQKLIASTLSALDDKIENNNKINENLEQQAQEIFKHWFVDFEFPDENGMPYKSSGGEMVESELGMIPSGWEVKKLKNIVNIKYGKNLPVKNLLSTGYNVFGGNGVIGHYDEYIYEEPEVLIACRGAASGKINISTPKSFVTNNSLVLESSTREVFEYIKGRFTHEDLEKYVTGSAQPQITITNIADVGIIMPDPETLKKYYNISNPFSNLILKNQIQNQKLSELRDTLLPKLMSGELRIPLDK